MLSLNNESNDSLNTFINTVLSKFNGVDHLYQGYIENYKG